MASNVWDMQRCTRCCSCGTLASSGSASFECSTATGQSLRSSLWVAGLHGGGGKVEMDKTRCGKRQIRSALTRSLYSPLVESFEKPRLKAHRDVESAKDSNLSSTTRYSSGPATPSAECQGTTQVGRSLGYGQVQKEIEDGDPLPKDPIAAAYGDDTGLEKMADVGHDLDAKRAARARPPSMSLSQSFSSAGRHAVTRTVGAVGRPLTNSAKIKGPAGVVMALAVAVLGLKTAAEKQGLLSGTPQKVCEKCDGYGVEQCHVCQGRGRLVWEGKLLHDDPCPLCFRSCVKKCSTCGGVKVKKGIPPSLLAQSSQPGAMGK